MLRHARVLTEIGLLTYLLTIPMGRAFVAWGRELPLLVIVAGLVLARMPGARATTPTAPFRLLIPLTLFAVSTLLSLVFSESLEESFAWVAYAPIAFLFFLATQEVAVTLPAYRRILFVFAAVVIVLGVDGVYQFSTGVSLLGGSLPIRRHTGGEALTASLPNPNDLALIPILLPMMLTPVVQSPSAWSSWLILAGLPFSFFTVTLSGSRNAWLGLAVGLGALAAFGARRRAILGAAGIAAVLFALAYALGIGDLRERARTILETPRDPRIAQWLVAVEMFKESPLLGKGLHTFGEFYVSYLEKIKLPAGVTPDVARHIPWAHNLYLEILAERGLLGAVGFGAPLIAMAVLLRRSLKRETAAEIRGIALGLTASLLSFLAQGVFDLTFRKDWVLLIFWLLVALVARLPDIIQGGRVSVSATSSP